MNRSALRLAILLALVACFSVGEAWANVITVNNPSFEILPPGGLPLPCGTDCSYDLSTAIPGWTHSGFGGQFQPGPPATTTYFNYVPDGTTIAATGDPNIPPAISPPITQIVDATVVSGMIYTLTVDLGTRNDRPFGSEAGLLIGGTLYIARGSIPSAGNWNTFTATFTGTNATASDSIEIELLNTGNQGDFDNVHLSDSLAPTVPEPNSLSLLVLGLGGLATVARRKLRS